ncbi:MAG: thiamine diphosphokinase [bacterium]|nr:thiamine diphosphokinase [bacterium]
MKTGGASSPIFPRSGKRAVVLCDGPPPPRSVLAYWLDGADLFLCADRAGFPYDHLPKRPDVVIGDFDSLAGDVPENPDRSRFIHCVEEDTTDSEKALLHAEEHGCVEAVLLGATGWLLDHTLFNCSLPERFAGRLAICLAGARDTTIRLGPGESLSWEIPEGTGFSLMALVGPVTGVRISGAAYSLRSGRIEIAAGPAPVSNRVIAPPLALSVAEGSLLVSVRHEDPSALRGNRG